MFTEINFFCVENFSEFIVQQGIQRHTLTRANPFFAYQIEPETLREWVNTFSP